MSSRDMTPLHSTPDQDPTILTLEQRFYLDVMEVLTTARIPFLVGGGFALASYTGRTRETKDLDLFVLQHDFPRIMEICSAAGYQTKLRFEHWLGKVFRGNAFVDIIFGSGNGLCMVDEAWFQHAVPGKVFNRPVMLCPAEETIWSKAFIMERDRFDGADIAHLLNAKGKELDWARLLRRFQSHWRVLFSHLVLCGYIYPSDRSKIPDWLTKEFIRRIELEMNNAPSAERVCQGTLLSWSQYLADIEEGHYQDARHSPRGNMTKEQTTTLTDIFRNEEGHSSTGPPGSKPLTGSTRSPNDD